MDWSEQLLAKSGITVFLSFHNKQMIHFNASAHIMYKLTSTYLHNELTLQKQIALCTIRKTEALYAAIIAFYVQHKPGPDLKGHHHWRATISKVIILTPHQVNPALSQAIRLFI